MAARQQQQRSSTWIDYYKVGLENGEVTEAPGDEFSSLEVDFLNNEEKLLNSVLEQPKLNFVLIPSTKRGYFVSSQMWGPRCRGPSCATWPAGKIFLIC